VHPLARAKSGFCQIVIDYIKDDYALYQLPCPELKHLGLSRQPMSKEAYNTESYKKLCEKLASEVVEDLKKYKEDDVLIHVLHGINGSPTCSITGLRGHFMDILIPMLKSEKIDLLFNEVPTDYIE